VDCVGYDNLYVTSEIIYDPEIAGFRMKSCYNSWQCGTYEVIGNIIENPGLDVVYIRTTSNRIKKDLTTHIK